jgi:outer membrane protein assembly factor BamB
MFRGPNGSGTNQKLQLPETPDLTHIRWKIDAGKGGSSVVGVGDKLFLTAFDDKSRYLRCLDADTGKLLWTQSIPKLRQETATPPNDPAICTPVSDGVHVAAFFPDAGLVVADLDGKVMWQKDLGPFYSMHGISTSPLLVDNKLILAIDQLRDAYIVALDIQSGNQLWKTERLLGVTGGYSTPIAMKWRGRDMIVSASPGELVGYNLKDGEKLFACTGVTNAPVGLPVLQGDRIYYCEPPGEPIPMQALGNADRNNDGVIELAEVKSNLGAYRLIERIDHGFGNGDGKVDQAEWSKGFGTFLNNGGLSCIELYEVDGKIETKVHWKYSKATPYIPSLVLAKDQVAMINDGGILIVFQADSGDIVKRQRLTDATGQYYASPVFDGERLVLANLQGKLSFVQAGGEWKSLAVLDLEERIVATPAIHQGHLLVRTESQLICF